MRSVKVVFTIYIAVIVAGLAYAIALGILEH
jgi:hypothetical protein